MLAVLLLCLAGNAHAGIFDEAKNVRNW